MPTSSASRSTARPASKQSSHADLIRESMAAKGRTSLVVLAMYGRRVPRFSPGQYQRVSLSPVSAITDMVAPVVLITVAVIFANGLMTAGIVSIERMFALNRERLGILGGPHGEVLDEDSVPPIDRERLTQIRVEMPLIMRRVGRIRNAVLIIWFAIGLFVLSVAAIAVAVTARSEAFAFTALALIMAGVAGVFGGVAAMLGPMARSSDALIDETKRTGALGKPHSI